ncbi:uncharacterized protein LOC122037054 isoform X2 [Zingiber officinale]|uniref:uncharacterized protein LOC122037054 isoform X2 n=1 Tax=Zingiber officinale TaxID=94328 RepID=UPI001C4C5DE0|nr:uncharacterized protein LOC122037054 isoform X2 [Zingiber officinale]
MRASRLCLHHLPVLSYLSVVVISHRPNPTLLLSLHNFILVQQVSDEGVFPPGDAGMHQGSSSIDSFFNDVKEGVDEMIVSLANDPTVGLFFVQQHAHASMPYLLGVKDKVRKKIHEVSLHTENMEDSICSVRSMAECGTPIADGMIEDINRSLQLMSASKLKRGLTRDTSWGFRVSNPNTGNSFSHRYLSSIFDSVKQKATRLGWPQSSTVKDYKCDRSSSEASSQVSREGTHTDTEGYGAFKSEQEAKFKEWLQEPERHD